MQLASVRVGETVRAALLVSGGAVDVQRHISEAPSDLADLVRDWGRHAAAVQALAGKTPDYASGAFQFAPPIARPGKIFALGMNYRDHCAESDLPIPEHQSWFTKAVTSITGAHDAIELPAVSDQLDYEAELVVVIGKQARNVPLDRVAEVVFGYCVGNDVSVRDWQLLTRQHCLGKSFDKAAPIGPWIVTADSVDISSVGIRSFVNGELRQNSNTSNFIFSVAEMVCHLSKAMTLEPGDILFTGTPAGVGFHWKSGQSFLREGDMVRVEIDGLGAIENRVERGPAEPVIG